MQDDQYSFLLRYYHWIGAAVFIIAFLLGEVMEDSEGGLSGTSLTFFHASFGLASLALVALRLLERTRKTPPKGLNSHANWEKRLSKAVQVALYAVMIGLPITGMMMFWSKGGSVPFFGLFELASPFGENRSLHGFFEEVHESASGLIFPLLGLHILGALKHHFWDQDATLSRISPFPN